MKELERYQELVNKEIKRLAESIRKDKKGFLKFNYDLLDEYLLRGGKRLRAIACIKTYESFTKKKHKKMLLPAIALELFHASSLVHDDIMDEDELRRNKASMHKIYRDWFNRNFEDKKYKGNIFNKDSTRFSVSEAIVQGNILFSLGLDCLTRCNFPEKEKNHALDLIQQGYREVNDGQLLDMVNEFKKEITEKEYIEMARKKTGVLFATSFALGAILAKTDKKSREDISDFAMNIAVAFQIQDDIMDISNQMKKGNTLGSDIKKGKMTLLMINALKKSSKKQEQYLRKIAGKTNATKQEILKVVKILEETGSVKRAKKLADLHIKKGKDSLDLLKKKISKEGYAFFVELSDYMTRRVI